jgi:hypothetical protein
MVIGPLERVGVSSHPPAEWLPRLDAHQRGRQWVPPLGIADTPVRAVVNHGRWIVSCPGCSSASWVTPTDPRFWCGGCENVRVNGRWLPVTFPPKLVREEAERILECRVPADQNWNPETEDAVKLMGENVTLNLEPYAGWSTHGGY